MAVDAPLPCRARPLATMVLTVQDKWVFVFHKIPVLFNVEKIYDLCFLQTTTYVKKLTKFWLDVHVVLSNIIVCGSYESLFIVVCHFIAVRVTRLPCHWKVIKRLLLLHYNDSTRTHATVYWNINSNLCIAYNPSAAYCCIYINVTSECMFAMNP